MPYRPLHVVIIHRYIFRALFSNNLPSRIQVDCMVRMSILGIIRFHKLIPRLRQNHITICQKIFQFVTL